MNALPNKAGVLVASRGVQRDLEALEAGTSEEEVVRVAMKSALKESHCFMCYSDDEKFQAALAGLMLFWRNDIERRHRLEHEIRMMKALSAAISGVAVDWSSMLPDDEEAVKGFGLQKAFADALKERGR